MSKAKTGLQGIDMSKNSSVSWSTGRMNILWLRFEYALVDAHFHKIGSVANHKGILLARGFVLSLTPGVIKDATMTLLGPFIGSNAGHGRRRVEVNHASAVAIL